MQQVFRTIRWSLLSFTLLVAVQWNARFVAAQSAPAKTVAVVTIPAVITEADALDELSALLMGGEVTTFRRLVERLSRAADDEQVAAVVLKGGFSALGSAQIEELRRVLDQIKGKGKPVYAHVDTLDMEQYVLLSGASRLSVSPTGDVWVTGIYSESPYLRGLLDKLGVEPDFMTCGAYKSAAEIFTRTGPSVEAKENREWLVDGLFSSYLRLISEGRGVPVEKVESWVNGGLYTAEQARQAGLIDAVEYHQDFLTHIKNTHGGDVQFDKRYGRPKQKSLDLSSPFGVFQFYLDLLGGSKPKPSTKDAVAVVYVEGPILPGSPQSDPFSGLAGGAAYSTPIRAALDQAARDPHVKAVVLRVDSPGGSAVASEVILEATCRVKAVKPFVVSMGNVAGSGGYYVACGADTVFAESTTITGSIGVVGGKLATRGLWDKIGVHWEPVKRGENAGMIYSADKFSPGERQRLQQWMDEVYRVFKNHVTSIRGSRLKKDIEDLAGGRVYTGRQALELGLVDRLGGLSEAIQYAAGQAGLEAGKYEVRTLPEAPSFLDLLLGETPEDKDPAILRIQEALNLQLSGSASGYRWLVSVEPRRSRALYQAIWELSVLQRDRIALFMAPLVVGAGR